MTGNGAPAFDTSVAHQARIYDYLLGGKDNYVADRAAVDAILAQASELLDFSEPVAVTLIAILHAIPESDDPHGIAGRLMDAVPPGSHLAVSHMGTGLLDSKTQHGLEDHSGRAMQQRLTARSREKVARFFAGMDLVPPGVVRVEDWRPAPGAGAGQSVLWGAVGRKP